MAKTTQRTREYRFRISKAGSTSLGSSTDVDVEFTTTEDPDHLVGIDRWSGQKVNPLQGSANSLPWQVNVAETSANQDVIAAFSSTKTAGHDIIRRRADFSVAEPATGSFEVQAGGRVSDVDLSPNVADYQFSVRDETFAAAQTAAFTSNDTKMIPLGPASAFGAPRFRTEATDTITFKVRGVSTGESADIVPDEDIQFFITNDIAEEIIDDVIVNPEPNRDNFENLRVRATTLPSTAQDISPIYFFTGPLANDPTKKLESKLQASTGPFVDLENIVIHTTRFSVGDTFEGFLHAFGRDPSTVLPLHFGGTTGVDPMRFVENQYSTHEIGTVSTAFQTHSNSKPNALFDHPLKLDDLFLRITEPADNLQRWLEENIFKPHGVAPLVNEDGNIRPTYVRQPQDSTLISPTSELFTFSSSNIRDKHPNWETRSDDQVTSVKFDVSALIRSRGQSDEAPPSDFLKVIRGTGRTQQNTTIFGEHVENIRIRGFAEAGVEFEEETNKKVRIAQDLFQRFGFGPIRTQFRGMSDASTIMPGQFVVVDLDTMPKALDGVRGGPIIFQVLEKERTPKGPEFDLLELGPDAQPLSAPDLSMAQSSSNPEHSIDFTITNLPVGAGWQIRIAAQSTEPSGSSEWTLLDFAGSSEGTFPRGGFPFGETIWGQARATKTGRIGSDWSTSANAQTASPTAPSSLTISSTVCNQAVYTWANGTTEYPTQILLESSVQTQKVRGSNQHELIGLAADFTCGTTGLTGSVRHVGPFGGETTKATDTFNLSSNRADSPPMLGIVVADGFFTGSTFTSTEVLF